jgi:hypothetical protein
MKPKQYIFLTLLLTALLPGLLHADKYSGEIFQMAPGVANQAMGNTGYTDANNLSAAWWNPALLGIAGARGIELMHSEQFEGLMQFNHFASTWGSGNRLGLVVTHIGINDIALTGLENDSLPPSPDNQPYVRKTVNNNDLMAYFGMGTYQSEDFFLGITPKLAYRSLAGKYGYGFGADLGLLWMIGNKLAAGAVAKDFFTTQIFWQSGSQETVYPSANLELGYYTTLPVKRIPLQIRLGAESLLEGRAEAATVKAGILSADFHVGLAVQPIPQLKAMAGYDVDAPTAGLGIYVKSLSLEYAVKFGSDTDLGMSQRIAAGWRW